jgi:hypothetical protein
MPVSSARSHRRSSDGVPGLPSYSTIAASVSSTEVRKFHIIHPVVVNQNTRSPARASRCRTIFFRCSSRIPPWPCTIAFGSPVVPDEYRIHSGWSNGTGSNSNGPSARNPSSHPEPSRYPSRTTGAPISAAIESTAARRSKSLPPYR